MPTESEPNNIRSDVTTVQDLSTLVTGQLESAGDVDFYKFQVLKHTTLSLSFNNPHLFSDFAISVYGSVDSDTPIYRFDTFDSFSNFLWNTGENETYFIRVSAGTDYDASQYGITLASVTFNGVAENDTFSSSDAAIPNNNDDKSRANTATLATDIVGQLSSVTDKDYYKFTLDRAGTLAVSFDNPHLFSDFKLSVYSASGTDPLVSLSTFSDTSFNFSAAVAGNYYVVVENAAGGDFDTFQYHINVVYSGVILNGGADDDYLLGGTGGDSITGGLGADILLGKAGEDTLDGGLGSDTLIGGLGNDTFIVDKTTDVVIEKIGGGNDTLISSVNIAALVKNVENLSLTGPALSGVGNELGNYLAGNALNNSLYGKDGADTLDGGAGNDVLDGGKDNDVYIVDSATDRVVEAVGAGTDTVQARIDIKALALNVENLVLLNAVVVGKGNALDNTITGNGGHNNLNGLAGNDTLLGKGGNDAINGGVGNDQLWGGTVGVLSGDGSNDVFVFNTALSTTTNVDTIGDFEVGVDQILLGHTIFSKLLAGDLSAENFKSYSGVLVGQDANDYVLFEQTTGALYYDADASAVGAAVKFAVVVSPSGTLTENDISVA